MNERGIDTGEDVSRRLVTAHDSARAEDGDALCGRLRSIALAELSRRRKRLGRITSEQESAIRELLGSMAERISGYMIEQARECYSSGEVEKARAWSSVIM